jgi:hypothetical protein
MTQPPAPPYGAPPPGWGPNPYGPVVTVAADPSRINRPALFAFIGSLLGCLPAFALGAVAGAIVALVQIGKVPQRGKGFAWSAIAISGGWLALTVVLLGLGLGFPGSDALRQGFEEGLHPTGTAQRDQSGAIVKAGTVSLLDLRSGDCLVDGEYVDLDMFNGVPCSEPHRIEVFARLPLTATDTGEAEHEADGRCGVALWSYVPKFDFSRQMTFLAPVPERGGSAHTAVCLIYESSPRTGSVKQ